MSYYRQFRHYHSTKNEDALERYSAQTHRCYTVLEAQLAKSEGKSILPEGISAVDCHFEPWVRQHAFAGVSIDDCPYTKKWLEEFGGTPQVQAAYEKIKAAPKP